MPHVGRYGPERFVGVSAIGIARKWFQQPPKASWEHYDISLSKKAEAIARGAWLTDKYGCSWHVAGLECRAEQLARIARYREKFGYPLDGILQRGPLKPPSPPASD